MNAIVDCPQFLDDEGRREWWRLAPHVFAVVGTTAENAEKLGRFLVLFLEWRRLSAHNNEHGPLRTTRKGPRVTAEFKREQKLQRMMLPYYDQLGMSPRARAKIAARKARENDHPPKRGA